MPKIHANDIEIYYEIHGTGEPLILIAGLGYDSWMWHRMAPGLADHFQVIVFDNRGVGQTDKPPGPYSVHTLADDTVGLLAGLGIERAHVLGHSMGGFVAQAMALNHPKLVDRLILSATNFGGPHHIPVTAEAMAVLTDTSGDPIERLRRGILVSCTPGFGERHPDIIEVWLAYRAENPLQPEAYQAQMAVGLGLMDEQASFDGKLKDVEAPTLILFGEDDKVVPPGNAELLADQIPNSQVRILPEAGHFYPFDATDRAVEAIVGFLKAPIPEG
jgi:pimeloyl-ACP methyl ester carboxylesterase